MQKKTKKEQAAASALQDAKAVEYWLTDPETIKLSYLGEEMPFLLTDRAAELLHSIWGLDPFASLGWLSERFLDIFGSLVLSQGLKVSGANGQGMLLARLPEVLRADGREALHHFKVLLLWGFFYFDRSLTIDQLMVTPRTIIRIGREVWAAANDYGEGLSEDVPSPMEEELEAALEQEGNA